MDRELLGLSLSYHGSYLLDQLRAEEQLTLEDVIALKSTVPIPVSDEPRFVNNDCFFIWGSLYLLVASIDWPCEVANCVWARYNINGIASMFNSRELCSLYVQSTKVDCINTCLYLAKT